MSRARLPFVAPATVAAVAMLLGAVAGTGAACGSTASSEILQPITGVTLRAESLTAGHGCGTASTQLFKYSVLVLVANADDAANPSIPVAQKRYDEVVAGNVYDCFTDGTFVDLPVVVLPSGQTVGFYQLQVFAYNQASYAAATDLPRFMASLQANRFALLADVGDGGTGSVARAAIQADVTRIRALIPTFSTACNAEQLGLVQTLAVCNPLQLGTVGVSSK